MERKYNKLVRDNIPSIIEENGEIPIYHTLNSEEFWEALLKKMKNGGFEKRLFLDSVTPKK